MWCDFPARRPTWRGDHAPLEAYAFKSERSRKKLRTFKVVNNCRSPLSKRDKRKREDLNGHDRAGIAWINVSCRTALAKTPQAKEIGGGPCP